MDVYTAVPVETFNHSLNQVHKDLKEVSSPGQCYVSAELNRELTTLSHGMKHVQLDDTFLRECPQWKANFPMRKLAEERAAVVNNMHRAHTFLNDFKHRLGRDQVNNMLDNQVREAHHWAKQGTQSWRGEFDPLANSSQQRINQFCDWIGVTDRYTGFRNNLTRFHSNASLNEKDRDLVPQRSMERFNLPKQAQQSENLPISSQHNNYASNTNNRKLLTASMSKQELAGINMIYPGTSEYWDRYRRPTRDNMHKYQLNPTPDFNRTGRSVAKVEIIKPQSEYESRYKWTARLPPNRSLTFA